MKHSTYWPLVAGILLGGALLLAVRSLLMFPIAVLVALLPPIWAGWQRARAWVRETVTQPLEWRWTGTLPAGMQAAAAPFDESFQERGYRPAGCLTDAAGREVGAVYLHETLPIYALLLPTWMGEGTGEMLPYLATYFPDGGRLWTTPTLGLDRYAAAVQSGPPRLVQLRVEGAPTPLAMDGQHTGTLKPWISGKRQPLPTTPEALPGYLEADREYLRGQLARAGWVPLPAYLAALFGSTKGVLKF